jgi:hypothetical protein
MSTQIGVHLVEDPAILHQLQAAERELDDRLRLCGMLGYRGYDATAIANALAYAPVVSGLTQSIAAKIALDGLMGGRRCEDAEFWGSPLGRAVAYWGTGEVRPVSRASAAAALGYTRQNVLYMLRDGRLSRPVEAQDPALDLVSLASLSHAMRIKYPLGG